MEVLKISSKSNPNSVAGAIAGLVKENNYAEMQAIGAGALNQAIKAIAIARGFVAPSGKNLICIPAFTDIVIDGEERTAIKEAYASLQSSAEAAAKRGYVDAIVSADSLRQHLSYAFGMLYSKRDTQPAKKHGTI